MTRPTPSCPEHDAIAQLIRDNRAQWREYETSTGLRSDTFDDREDTLFAALAAVDDVRYTVFAAADLTAWAYDRWSAVYASDAVPFVGTDAPARARADVDQRNTVNVAARGQELQDELDGTDR